MFVTATRVQVYRVSQYHNKLATSEKMSTDLNKSHQTWKTLAMTTLIGSMSLACHVCDKGCCLLCMSSIIKHLVTKLAIDLLLLSVVLSNERA